MVGGPVVFAGIQPDGKGAARGLALRGFECGRAQEQFSLQQIQHEAVVVALAGARLGSVSFGRTRTFSFGCPLLLARL